MWEFIHNLRRKEPSNTSVNSVLAKRRADIINAILSGGLKSAERLNEEGVEYFGSNDWTQSSLVGVIMGYPGHREDVRRSLYISINSVLPVMIERKREGWGLAIPRDRDLQTARTSSTIIIACNLPLPISFSKKGCIEGGIIPPDKFSYLLFPRKIFQQTQPYLDRERVSRLPVVLIDKNVKRIVTRDNISIPDYEGALLNILKQSKKPLWVHGVRLPTEEDLHDN